MDAKQTILEYIGPTKSRKTMMWVFFSLAAALAAAGGILYAVTDANWPGILLFLAVLSLGGCVGGLSPNYFDAKKNAKRCFKRLEELGLLESAAAELTADGAVVIGKDKSRLTEHFAFSRHGGVVVSFDDIRWVFMYPGNSQYLDITTNLKNCTSFNPVKLANKKSNVDEIKTAYTYIIQHSPDAMVGYTEENLAKYRELKAEAKKAAGKK